MQAEFDALGIQMVAISPDTVAESARTAAKGLSMPILSDAELAVTDLYGVRHPGGLAPTPGKRGIRRPLAIPTTLLIDAGGVVRWIDRADDYRVRSEASRVLGAIRPLLA